LTNQLIDNSVLCFILKIADTNIILSYVSLFIDKTTIGMDMISLEGKTNFFEKRVAEYQKSGVMASIDGKDGNIDDLNFDDDF
jgi:hypothetical protein